MESRISITDDKTSESLNATQKNIIEGTLSFVFSSINELEPKPALIALNAMLGKEVSSTAFQNLISKDVVASLEQVTSILNHPYPQNRFQGNGNAYWQKELKGRAPVTTEEVKSIESGVSAGKVYFYKDGFGSEVLTEEQGILGLTSRNDKTTSPVTKQAVDDYIFSLIRKEIEIQNEKLKSQRKTFALHCPRGSGMRMFKPATENNPVLYFNALLKKEDGIKELFCYDFGTTRYEQWLCSSLSNFKIPDNAYVIKINLSTEKVKDLFANGKYEELLPYVQTLYKQTYGLYKARVVFNGKEFATPNIKTEYEIDNIFNLGEGTVSIGHEKKHKI